jgi:hypothetical protein
MRGTDNVGKRLKLKDPGNKGLRVVLAQGKNVHAAWH